MDGCSALHARMHLPPPPPPGQPAQASLPAPLQLPSPSLHRLCLQYDKARNFTNLINLMHNDQSPALVVYAASEDDVSAAVRFAAQRALPLCVRSGGHDSTGASICDKGVVVDVSQINWVRRRWGGDGVGWGVLQGAAGCSCCCRLHCSRVAAASTARVAAAAAAGGKLCCTVACPPNLVHTALPLHLPPAD